MKNLTTSQNLALIKKSYPTMRYKFSYESITGEIKYVFLAENGKNYIVDQSGNLKQIDLEVL